MKLSAILAPLVEAGVDAKTILLAVQAWESQQTDALERRRASDRERQERRRHVTSREPSVTVSSRDHATRVEDNNKTLSSNKDISSLRSENISLKDEFETEFWPSYPRKVGKGQAAKAYATARKKADLGTIMAGLRRYASERAGQDPNFTKHAATWLNGECWGDEPARTFRQAQAPPMTAHQQRHQAALNAFNGTTKAKPHDEFTGDTLDLGPADFRPH